MRMPPPLFCTAMIAPFLLLSLDGFAEESQPIVLATHNQTPLPLSPTDAQAIERICKIVLNQGEDARALANLVQLTRKLPAPTTSRLYYDLARKYLQSGKYNQAANLLQQLLNQHPDQPIAGDALVTLVRLYSSSEVTHSQQTNSASAEGQMGLLKYALYTVDRTLQRNATLGDHPALIFQRAVATRLGGRLQAAQSRLTRLKHNLQAEPWRTYARTEQWLQSDREDESPLPVVVCHRTDKRPHLDGLLGDQLWHASELVQFSYDDQFLYLAISAAKVVGQNYAVDARPRTYDADLTGHDSLRIRLDVDRDYATYFELTIDHRGQTNDRCWLDTSWNPAWFVAAGEGDSHWTAEGAIPWESLTSSPPKRGEAWAITYSRMLPKHSVGKGVSASKQPFSLLLFQ